MLDIYWLKENGITKHSTPRIKFGYWWVTVGRVMRSRVPPKAILNPDRVGPPNLPPCGATSKGSRGVRKKW
jgi:hypothetical protein